MGHYTHRTRREILQSISVLGSGSLLLPLGVLRGQKPDTRTPGVIRGELRDGATGEPVAAKIRVVNTASNEVYMPAGAIKTMPQRAASSVRHYFYARGKYEVAVPPGRYQIEAAADDRDGPRFCGRGYRKAAWRRSGRRSGRSPRRRPCSCCTRPEGRGSTA